MPNPQHPAEPVAWIRQEDLDDLRDTDDDVYKTATVSDEAYGVPLYLRPDPEVAALRAEVEGFRNAARIANDMLNEYGEESAYAKKRLEEAEATIARVRALADEWEVEAAKLRAQGAKAQRRGDDNDAEVCFTAGQDTLAFVHELRAALEGSA